MLIHFGSTSSHEGLRTAARFGVWSYCHGDTERYRGGPACFWEVFEGNPLSGVVLQVQFGGPEESIVVCKGIVATSPGLSAARNRYAPYWTANAFMIQKLHELHEHGWESVRSRAVVPEPYRGRKSVYAAPTNREMIRWLVPAVAGRIIQRLTRRPRAPHWRLAIRRCNRSLLDGDSTPDMSGFLWIESPRGRFYADPFLIEHSGKTWLFFEDFDYATRRGRIAAAEIDDDNRMHEAVTVLTKPYHLSYPCVFRDGADLFMIPETGENGTVELYRCLDFPNNWTLEKVLVRERAVDTTVWIEDGRYWFFVTFVEPRSRGTQLWLFSADSLTGVWTPHPANPISTDVRNSRGAGALFRHDGKLFRPSQDCGERHGRSFSFNEIVTLTPDRYEERRSTDDHASCRFHWHAYLQSRRPTRGHRWLRARARGRPGSDTSAPERADRSTSNFATKLVTHTAGCRLHL